MCYMYFADNFILFCGVDYFLIFMFFRGFVIFFKASGLLVNQGKSEIYAGNVDIEVMNRIVQVLSFRMDRLFFKYLGVLISF